MANFHHPKRYEGANVHTSTKRMNKKRAKITIIMILTHRAPNNCQFVLMIIYWRLYAKKNSNRISFWLSVTGSTFYEHIPKSLT